MSMDVLMKSAVLLRRYTFGALLSDLAAAMRGMDYRRV